MGGLVRRGFFLALAASGVVFLLGVLAASVRLLPWWLSHDVPLSVSMPFALALLAAALEAALLIGAPLGLALTVGMAVESGEVRALEALGASPWQIARSLWPVPAALGLLVGGLDMAWDARSAPPGVFAQKLVEEAKTSCYDTDETRAISVPLVNVTWMCFPGQPPRVIAPLPGGGDAWVVAQSVTFSADLRSIVLRKMRILTRPAEGRPTLHVSVESGSIRGLPGWGRGTRLSGSQRGIVAVLVLFGASIAVAWSVLRGKLGALIAIVPMGLLPPALGLAVMSRLDASDLPLSLFAAVPAACALLPIALLWPARRFRR